MKSEFSRVNLLPNYVFAEINQLKAKLRKKGNDIIDFGMGNPDMPTPKHIRDKLKEVVDKPGVGRTGKRKKAKARQKSFRNYQGHVNHFLRSCPISHRIWHCCVFRRSPSPPYPSRANSTQIFDLAGLLDGSHSSKPGLP